MRADNILITSVEFDSQVTPIEGPMTIVGESFTTFLAPQPLSYQWREDDDMDQLATYSMRLCGFGSGE